MSSVLFSAALCQAQSGEPGFTASVVRAPYPLAQTGATVANCSDATFVLGGSASSGIPKAATSVNVNASGMFFGDFKVNLGANFDQNQVFYS